MKQTLQDIPLNQIHADSNYRKTFNDKSLKELAASIKKNGVIEPIIVRQNETGFAIVAGERRYRASHLAGLVTIPALIREIADADVLKVQIIENVQREGVQYMEEAYGIKRLRDEADLDVAEIARIIGKSDAYVYQQLRLTSLPDEVQTIARNHWISKSVAWLIAQLPNIDEQIKAAKDLARPKGPANLITASGAKNYIRDNFGDSAGAFRKQRVMKLGEKSNDYAANWKFHLVRFSCEQFEQFKAIVRGRTETDVLAETVDMVMRGSETPVAEKEMVWANA